MASGLIFALPTKNPQILDQTRDKRSSSLLPFISDEDKKFVCLFVTDDEAK